MKKDRLESVAEHIYGVCILAIAIDSEFRLEIDLEKSIFMIILHELEEIVIGDITPCDNIDDRIRKVKGDKAIQQILQHLTKGQKYIDLLREFEALKTPEAKFARMCDKLECNVYVKMLCETGRVNLFARENEELVSNLQSRYKFHKNTLLSDLFIENDRKYFFDRQMEEILDYVKANNIVELEKI